VPSVELRAAICQISGVSVRELTGTFEFGVALADRCQFQMGVAAELFHLT
jgi:hypothetical protein